MSGPGTAKRISHPARMAVAAHTLERIVRSAIMRTSGTQVIVRMNGYVR